MSGRMFEGERNHINEKRTLQVECFRGEVNYLYFFVRSGNFRKKASWGSGMSFMRTGYFRKKASRERGISFIRAPHFRKNASEGGGISCMRTGHFRKMIQG